MSLRSRRKQKELSFLAHRNSSHLQEVKSRLEKVKKEKQKAHLNTLVKILENQKRRELILKDLQRTRNYRSASAYRNK